MKDGRLVGWLVVSEENEKAWDDRGYIQTSVSIKLPHDTCHVGFLPAVSLSVVPEAGDFA